MAYKLGSLFDGSGGFPLAGSLCGVEPMWAAEVEPYPIAVTKSRFPDMKHLGDISKINGADIEPVDIITFGSPCQDLSVAGKRAGLKHEANGDEETTRSGLFMEAVRIIKEMREATNGEYPSFALWENVPGAFSSNKGEDFRLVCEELIKIVEPSATMPAVPKNGWPYADSYCGDGWSLAYRVFDAQYWGVPQRRRRIHLVLDLRDQRARQVSFEREGVRGYFASGRSPWQSPTAHAENSLGADDRAGEGNGGLDAVAYTLKIRSGVAVDSNGKAAGKGALVQVDKAATLATSNDQYLFQPIPASDSNLAATLYAAYGTKWNGNAGAYNGENFVLEPLGKETQQDGTEMPENALSVAEVAAGFCTEHSAKAGGVGFQEECAPILRAGVTPACVYSVENHPADSRVDIDDSGKVQTLTSRMGTGGGNVPMVMEPKPVYCLQGNGIDRADTAGCNGKGWKEDTCYTLNTIDRPAVCYSLDEKMGQTYVWEEQANTLAARDYKQPQAVAFPTSGKESGGTPMENEGAKHGHGDREVFSSAFQYIVRRLTPTECARLQGFADRWGDIDEKETLTPDEFQFWHEVRNTHAAINGKKVGEYTEAQMLTWYNKLHTDSAEYKMWGNGIALPPALYVLQGMVDALEAMSADDWML